MREMTMQTSEDSFLSSDSYTANMREKPIPNHLDCGGRAGGSNGFKREALSYYTALIPRCLVWGPSQMCAQSLAQVYASLIEGCSHVVGHIDWVQLVCEERVSQVHPLLLAPGVDGNHSWVNNDHHTHNQVVLFQNHISN